jgi:hypothetical protein
MILPESATLNARAREAVRNTWMGSSIVRAAKRNVAGSGVDVVPLAKGDDGNLLKNLNRRIKDDFWWWGSDKNHCDVEQRQNFWQKQRLCVAERKTVGQVFVVWSYRAPLDAYGGIDNRQPVGLKLQTFEAEQLDHDDYELPGPRGPRRRRTRPREQCRGRVPLLHAQPERLPLPHPLQLDPRPPRPGVPLLRPGPRAPDSGRDGVRADPARPAGRGPV